MREPSRDRRGRRVRATTLGIRFALELCVLASFAAWAAHLAVPIWTQALLGIVFCASGAAVWGAFLSPKRRYEIGLAGRLVLEAGFGAFGRKTWKIALFSRRLGNQPCRRERLHWRSGVGPRAYAPL